MNTPDANALISVSEALPSLYYNKSTIICSYITSPKSTYEFRHYLF